MSILHISLFGSLQVSCNDGEPEIKLTPSIQTLFAYLLLQRHRTHPREVLAGLFWGGYSPEHARSNLNTALWRLRKVLEPPGLPGGTYLLTTSQGEVGFNAQSHYWLDIAVFEERVASALVVPDHGGIPEFAQSLECALNLYTGELLEGIYEDWTIREREHLRRLYLNGLVLLMQYYKNQRDFERSLSFGERLLAIDPLREEIHREMMRLYMLNGQRALAVRQYNLCYQTLSDELNILPMEETQALYSLITESAASGFLSEPVNNQIILRQISHQLQEAAQNLEAANTQFQQAVLLMESFFENQKLCR